MNRKIASALQKRLWPHLQALGFQYHIGRSYYRLADGQVWYAASRALNAHLQHIGRPSTDSAFDCVAGIYHFDADEQAVVERYLQARAPYWGTQYLMNVQCDDAPSQSGGGRRKDMSLWRVAADGSNLDAVMDDFEAAFVQQALPFWTRMSSAANAAAARQYNAEKRAQAAEFRECYLDAVPGGKPDGGRLYAAGFYLLAGEAEKARETLLLEIEHAPQRAARAHEWAARQGIALS